MTIILPLYNEEKILSIEFWEHRGASIANGMLDFFLMLFRAGRFIIFTLEANPENHQRRMAPLLLKVFLQL